jgi:uncharacterized protein (DUF302 family)
LLSDLIASVRWKLFGKSGGLQAARKLLAVLTVIFVAGARAMAADELTTIASNFDPMQAAKRLEAEIKAKGMTVFARVDHAAGAKEAGLELRPTEVLIFGSAKGTPLMQADPTIGIDLPMKVLVWQDAAGKTWISYNDPDYLAVRHRLGDDFKPIFDKMRATSAEVANKAAGTK